MRSVVARFWHGWKEATGYFGDFQARLLLTVLYFTLLAPWGLLLHRFGDPLRIRARPLASAWTARQAEGPTMKEALRQF